MTVRRIGVRQAGHTGSSDKDECFTAPTRESPTSRGDVRRVMVIGAPNCLGALLFSQREADMTLNWIKPVVLASAVLLAASLGGGCARAMGDEPATGGETITQYLNP